MYDQSLALHKQPAPAGQAVVSVLEQIAARRGLTTTLNPTTRHTPVNSVCSMCSGAGFIVPDLAVGTPAYGKAQRCPICNANYDRVCGLTDAELAYTVDSIAGAGPTTTMLRALAAHIIANPVGMVTLWGTYGTAKTMAVQIVVAALVRNRTAARFYHAKQIEQGWFDDHDNDRMNAQTYLHTPVLAIDELDKVNTKNDWVRQQFQALLDYRYRMACAGRQLTLITLNGDPAQVMPGDIASRLADGRFARPWPADVPGPVIERHGDRLLPGIVPVGGKDARPYMRSMFTAQEES